MLSALLRKLIGSKNDRELKRIRPVVEEINQFEPEFTKLSAEELRAKTDDFKSRIQTKTQDVRLQLEKIQRQVVESEDEEERTSLKEESEKIETELRAAEADVLNEILPQAFAAVREASRRVTGMRHFDVQLLGGIVLHQGKI